MIGRTIFATCAGFLTLLPAAAHACSGPRAAETIAWNARAGTAAFLLALCCFVAAIVVRRRRSRRLLPFLLWGIVFVPFPFIVPGPLIGDCGITFLTANILLATAYVVVLFLQILLETFSVPSRH